MKLRNYKNGKGCKVATQRSRVTRRTIRVIEHNLQEKTLNTRVFGAMKLLASVRDFRTINKYSSFENYLLSVKERDLSTDVLSKKKQLMSYLVEALQLENVTSLLSHSNKEQGIKTKMINHINELYVIKSLSA